MIRTKGSDLVPRFQCCTIRLCLSPLPSSWSNEQIDLFGYEPSLVRTYDDENVPMVDTVDRPIPFTLFVRCASCVNTKKQRNHRGGRIFVLYIRHEYPKDQTMPYSLMRYMFYWNVRFAKLQNQDRRGDFLRQWLYQYGGLRRRWDIIHESENTIDLTVDLVNSLADLLVNLAMPCRWIEGRYQVKIHLARLTLSCNAAQGSNMLCIFLHIQGFLYWYSVEVSGKWHA